MTKRLGAWLWALVAVAASAAFIVISSIDPGPAVERQLQPSEIAISSGGGYYVSTHLQPKWPWVTEIRGDSNDDGAASLLVLRENGNTLAPAHSLHTEIIGIGGGRYSHWGTGDDSIVLFSSSDGSDPRNNGRSYTISAQPNASKVASTIGLIVTLVAIFIATKFLQRPWLGATLALGASATLAWIWLVFDRVILYPDSGTYMVWSQLVPLGYPLFLSAVKLLTGSFAWTGTVQALALMLSTIFVATAGEKIGSAGAISFFILLLLLVDTPLFRESASILSDPLFVALILLNIAFAFRLINRFTIGSALMLALTAAAIMFVRPAGYFAPLGVLFIVLAKAGATRQTAVWALLPLLLMFGATLAINDTVRGTLSQSQSGRLLFAHAAFLFDPSYASGPDQQYALAAEAALASHRKAYQMSKDEAGRFAFLMNDYNQKMTDLDTSLRPLVTSELLARHDGSQISSNDVFHTLDSVELRLFLDVIRNNPFGYIDFTLQHMVDAWQLSVFSRDNGWRQNYFPSFIENNAFYTASSVDGNFKRENVGIPSVRLYQFPAVFVGIFDATRQMLTGWRWLIYMIGVMTFVAIPIAIFFRRQYKRWLALGYCGVMIHGAMCLTAAVTVFIPRYTLPVDPIILIAGAIMVDGIVVWVRGHNWLGRLSATTFFTRAPMARK
jgi:hypothetical protein